MLEFVTQKMWNKKWMMLCLIIGNILLIAVASCNPMYTDAIQQKTLRNKMSNFIINNNSYPGEIKVDATISTDSGKTKSERFFEAKNQVKEIKKNMNIDLLQSVTHYYVSKMKCVTESTYNGSVAAKELTLGMIQDVEQHIKMVSGELYAKEPDADGVIDAIISQKGLVEQKLLIGEILIFQNIKNHKNQPLKIRISGVFENSKEKDLFWVNSPSTFTSEILIAENCFMKQFGDFKHTPYKTNGVWHLLFDYEQMKGSNAKQLLEKAKSYQNFFSQNNAYAIQVRFAPILEEHIDSSRRVVSTLQVLEVPILMLLAAFIFMVSGQILQMEQNDISIIKSRGASKKQILMTYSIQSGLVAGIGLVIGIPLGAVLCQIFGSSNAFLEFVQRRALHIRISPAVLLYSVMAVFISVVAMIVPAFRFAGLTIVETKQKKTRKNNRVWWQKYFLDFVMLAVSLYGLYTFTNQKELLSERVAAGASLDPLLFFCSSLFILGAGLFAIRILPLFVCLIFKMKKNKWQPAFYTSFLQVIRTTSRQHFIMVFLILTIALGIFNAKAARTINTNAEHKLCYQNGADIVLMEQWSDDEEKDKKKKQEKAADQEGVKEEADISADDYTEPDVEKYKKIQGAEHIAKVYKTEDAAITIEASDSKVNSQKVTLMGIHTKDFGQTAWFDTKLLPQHWYHYLNAMSKNTSAILVSSNFKDKLGYKLGDVLTYTTAAGQNVRGVIYGFVDYWPGYRPSKIETNTDGSNNEIDNFLIVAHLRKLQNVDGVLPYQVWINISGSTQPVYDFIGEKKIKLSTFSDTHSELIEMKNDPVIQGTNGILTVGFIVVLTLCSVGFLIYWILSIRSRSLQFGIYRAMGMTRKEILQMLMCEQVLITGPAILSGSFIGMLASRLYIPLIQIAYTSADDVIPMHIVQTTLDLVKLYSVVFIVIGICMAVLGWLISKINVSQALKLGED